METETRQPKYFSIRTCASCETLRSEERLSTGSMTKSEEK